MTYDTDQYCKDCNKYTQTVEDHRQGDTICFECGLVLEAYLVDTSAEWRVFNHSENDAAPQRTGDPVNPLLADAASSLVTIVSQNPNNKTHNNNNNSFRRTNMVQQTLNPNERSLTSAFAAISNKAGMLGLVSTIVGRAQQIYKQADEKKLCRGGGSAKHEALTSACLFLASQEEGFPRTLKEIATVGNGAAMKEICKISEKLKKELGISGKVTKAEDLTARSCSSIRMSRAAMKAVNETLEKIKEVDVRRNPKSVLAAVMYMVVQLSNDATTTTTTLKEVSQAADVAVATTNKTYKDIYHYASSIIPSWFANQEDINKKLRIP